MSLQEKWIINSPNQLLLLVVFCRFIAMLGPLLLNNSGAFIFLCSLFGMLGYILVAIAAMLHNNNYCVTLVSAACLPEVVYAFVGDVSVLQWGIPLLTILATVVMAKLLVLKRSWSCGVEYLLLASCVGVGLVHILHDDITQWWTQELLVVINSAVEQAAVADKAKIMQLMQWLPQLQTGYTFVIWMLFLPMCLVHFAKNYLQNITELFVGYSSGIKLSRLLAIIGVVAMIIGVSLATPVLIDMLPIWVLIFVISGISLVHEFASKQERKYVILIAHYILLIFISKIMVFLLLVLGFLDCLFNLRGKLLNK